MRLLEIWLAGAAFAAILWGMVGLMLIVEDRLSVQRVFIGWFINTAAWPITIAQAAYAVATSLLKGGES